MFCLRNFLKKVKLKQVKFIIWDFDGTLYTDPVGGYIRQQYFNYLADRQEINEKEFDTLSKKYGKWSKVVSVLLEVPEIEIMDAVENRKEYAFKLKPNPMLVSKISKMSKYRHIILTNSSLALVEHGLKQIGFIRMHGMKYFPFEKIFSRDVNKSLKPDKKAFMSVIHYTKHTPNKHLVVGDSYYHDIRPARDLGFQVEDVNEFWNNTFNLLEK